MTGIFDQSGYIAVPEDGDFSAVDKAKQKIAEFDAAPDYRLVAANLQPQQKSDTRLTVERALDGGPAYILESDDPISLRERAGTFLQVNDAAPPLQLVQMNLQRRSGFSIIMDELLGSDEAPEPTEGMQLADVIRQNKNALQVELAKQKGISKIKRLIAEGEIADAGRVKAKEAHLYEAGARRGRTEAKVIETVFTVSDGIGQTAQSVRDKAGQMLFNMGRWVSGRFRKGGNGQPIDVTPEDVK